MMKISCLDLFIVFFPVKYLNDVVAPQKNNIFEPATHLSDFPWWMGCWFYMVDWVGISNQTYWWSSSESTFYKGDPFQLNDYISCNQYDDIIVSLFYTDWEMDYKDDFFS